MRLHLFEFEDLSWYPDFIRRGQTDFLRMLMRVFDVFRAVIPTFGKALKQSGKDRIIDLCSGGGGSMIQIRNGLKKEGIETQIVLSDLYPNIDAFELMKKQTDGEINYFSHSVNAQNFPKHLDGFLTIFNGFHHFQPTQAKQILKNAVDNKLPIAVFEPLEKTIFQFLLNTISLIILPFLFTPFIRPFRFDRLIFTYLIPLIPICTLWDGWVSVIRLYKPEEMEEMARSVDSKTQYKWQSGKAKHTFGVVTYLIGVPKN